MKLIFLKVSFHIIQASLPPKLCPQFGKTALNIGAKLLRFYRYKLDILHNFPDWVGLWKPAYGWAYFNGFLPHQIYIWSNLYLIKCISHQIYTSSNLYLIKFIPHQIYISSNLYLIKFIFHQIYISSTIMFVYESCVFQIISRYFL